MRARAASARTVSSFSNASSAARASASLGFLCRTAEYVLTESAPVPKRAASPSGMWQWWQPAKPTKIAGFQAVAGEVGWCASGVAAAGRSAALGELREDTGDHAVAPRRLERVQLGDGLAGVLLERGTEQALALERRCFTLSGVSPSTSATSAVESCWISRRTNTDAVGLREPIDELLEQVVELGAGEALLGARRSRAWRAPRRGRRGRPAASGAPAGAAGGPR